MCGSMVYIQSATAEIRQGKKKEERKKIEITGQKYNGLPYYIYRATIISYLGVRHSLRRSIDLLNVS